MNASDLPPLLTPEQLAELFGVPIGTVRAWRLKNTGPQGFRVGRHVRYRREAVLAYIAAQEADERKSA